MHSEILFDLDEWLELRLKEHEPGSIAASTIKQVQSKIEELREEWSRVGREEWSKVGNDE